jgi:hypothetical protein
MGLGAQVGSIGGRAVGVNPSGHATSSVGTLPRATLTCRVRGSLVEQRFPLLYGRDCAVLLGALPALRDQLGSARWPTSQRRGKCWVLRVVLVTFVTAR